MPFCPYAKDIYPTEKRSEMDASTLYSMYTSAMDSGKLTVLEMFIDAIKEHPIIAAFYIWLLFRKPSKTVSAFIDRFI